MSFHPEVYPSVQLAAFEASRSSFKEKISGSIETRKVVNRADIVSSFFALVLKGAEAIGTDNTPMCRLGLQASSYVSLVEEAYTDLYSLNDRGLIKPPIVPAELSMLNLFVQQTNPDNRV